jgi:aminoglycoside 6'-N-acetyltransferase
VDVRLTAVGPEDLALIELWLNSEEVRRYWGDPEENIRLFRAPPAPGAWRAIIETGGRKVGLVLWQHPTRRELDEAGLFDLPESVIDIDIMIGEKAETGRGVGSAAIRMVAGIALADASVPFVIASAEVDNQASQRAFAKAGFEIDREFDDVPGGRYVLMVKHRQNEPAMPQV